MAIFTKALRFGQKALTSALLRRGYRTDNYETVVRDFSPRWIGHFNKRQYQYIYELSPILKGIVDYKARASANVKRFVKDLNTGDILMPNTKDKGALKIYKLIKNPNPYQSEFEFFNQRKVNFEIFGDTYIYASMPEGFRKVSFLDINHLINLPSQFTKPIHTGKVIDQSELEGIVSKYLMEIGVFKKEFEPNTILHRNDINISGFAGNALNNEFGVTAGRSRLESLMMPLSNIQRAYESRNVIITHRGALGIFSSNLKDASGSYPMLDDQKKKVQEDIKQYGTLSDQHMFIISRMPVTYQPITQSVKELMLFEEISTDTIVISISFGVPEILVKNYLKGATYENQQASVRRMYQETLIPEGDDDNEAINQFLKTREEGYEIISSYDHVDALQENKKEEADRKKINNEVAFQLFKADAITINEWLEMLDLPIVDHGKIRISDMDERAISILLGNYSFTNPVPVTEPINE